MLSKLNIHLCTPTPSVSWGSESSHNFTPKTPFTEKQLRWQASSIKALLCTRSQSPPSPSDRALNQLVKGCQLAMHNSILLAKENNELRAANEKKKQKCTQSKRQIPHEGGLSASEALELVGAPIEALIAPAPPQQGQPLPHLQPRTRAPWGCGICRVPGHRRETCPDRPR